MNLQHGVQGRYTIGQTPHCIDILAHFKRCILFILGTISFTFFHLQIYPQLSKPQGPFLPITPCSTFRGTISVLWVPYRIFLSGFQS